MCLHTASLYILVAPFLCEVITLPVGVLLLPFLATLVLFCAECIICGNKVAPVHGGVTPTLPYAGVCQLLRRLCCSLKCSHGCSSTSAVTSHFTVCVCMAPSDALLCRRVHAVRPWVCPNPGFRLQLERFAALGYDLSKW